MRKLTTLAVATALALSLVACGGSAATEGASNGAGGEEATGTTEISGGWETNAEVTGKMLTEEHVLLFEAATEQMTGVEYEPVAVIGEQVVAGMNYAYLCKATTVTPDAKPEWDVVVVYQDLEGNASFICANPIDLANPQVVTSEKGDVVGGWVVPEPSDGLSLPGDADAAFSTVAAELAADEKGYSLTPVALLGTQVVSGTNYQVLCLGTQGAVENAPYRLFDLVIYQNLEGKAELVSIDELDLDYYVSAPVEQ